MSPIVVSESRDDLVARREAILRALGMTVAQLREAAGIRTLSTEEWEACEELTEIDFLLGE